MPSAAQVKALLQSHSSGDDERFYAVALQVAAAEARNGHETLARDLRAIVDQAKTKASESKARSNVVQIAQPLGEAAEHLVRRQFHGPGALFALDDARRGVP